MVMFSGAGSREAAQELRQDPDMGSRRGRVVSGEWSGHHVTGSALARPPWFASRHVFLAASGPGKAGTPGQHTAAPSITILAPWSGLTLLFFQTLKLLQSGGVLGVSMDYIQGLAQSRCWIGFF